MNNQYNEIEKNIEQNEEEIEMAEDHKIIDLNSKLEKARQQLAQAEADYRTSAAEFIRIADEQRTIQENEGLFRTIDDLNKFEADYMNQKIEENERFEAAKKQMAKINKNIARIEKQIADRVIFQEEAKKVGISVEQYENIVKTLTKNKDEVLKQILDKQGLAEIVHKRGGRTKEEKQKLETARLEVLNTLVQESKNTTNTNILEMIDAIYQTDFTSRKVQNPRITKISEQDMKNIQQEITKLPQKISNQNKQKTSNPTPAPQGIPLGLPSGLVENKPIEMPQVTTSTKPIELPGQTINKTPFSPSSGMPNEKNNTEIPRLPGQTINSIPLLPSGLTDDKNKQDNEQKEKEPVDENNKNTTPKKSKPSKGFYTIIEEITKDLKITKKDGKIYKASNIQVRESFKNELQSGNYLYNVVHFVPALMKVPAQLLNKISGKIRSSKEHKTNMAILKQRIENLPEAELNTIYTEYRSGKVIQERYPSALNILLEERMKKYALGKVEEINTTLETQYRDVFSTVMELDTINEKLKDPKLTTSKKQALEDRKNNLLKGKAKEIESIRNNYIKANNWLSGGSHGFSEDMKAASTKLSIVGKRFAKEHDFDLELAAKQGALERQENDAIATGNDEQALRSFVEQERLLSSNTEIKSSIFGKRSTGKKYYSPLAQSLDYRDDPFIRDIFTTIAITGSAVSAVNAYRTHVEESSRVIAEQNAEVNRVNSANNATMAQVNQTGRDIVGKRETMMEGMEYQARQNTLTASNTIERAVLDKTGETYGDWALGTNEYHQYDSAGHDYFSNLYDQTESTIKDIASKYASGAISQQQAMQAFTDINQTTLTNVTSECLKILNDYAEKHPQFDLHGVEGAMNSMIENPEAIIQMNQAMVDTTNMGESLIGLSAEQMAAITSLPSDLRTTILGATSAAALAYNTATQAKANTRKSKYGNEVTQMVDEYMNQNNTQTNKFSAK